MTKILKALMIVGLAIFVVGCFDYAERLELNADGSGIFIQHMVLYKEGMEGMMPMLKGFSADSTGDSSRFSFIKRDDFEKKLASSNTSLKLVDFKETQTDSTTSYDVKISFANMADLSRFSNTWTEGPMVQSVAQKKEITFEKVASGGWKFTREFGDSSMANFGMPQPDIAATSDSTGQEPDSMSAENPLNDMGKMMYTMMMQAFGNRKVKLTVRFPGEVAESNATIIKGNEATWEYNVMDVASHPSILEATIRP